ncbi:MAG: serine protease [Planctomycetota bacterium]
MSLKHPENTIWFVAARSDKEAPLGSAVAIRIQEIGKGESAQTYLLTCAHVIREPSADGEHGCGPVMSEFWVWRPGKLFAERTAFKATVAGDVRAIDVNEIPTDERANGADDWVILKIEDAASRDTADVICDWDKAESGKVEVLGFPGGDASFIDNKVKCTRYSGRYFDSSDGVLVITGDSTRPGVSGGGVFNRKTNKLVGLHRARTVETSQLQAVSAWHVRSRLKECGYELVRTKCPYCYIKTLYYALAFVSVCVLGVWIAWPSNFYGQVLVDGNAVRSARIQILKNGSVQHEATINESDKGKFKLNANTRSQAYTLVIDVDSPIDFVPETREETFERGQTTRIELLSNELRELVERDVSLEKFLSMRAQSIYGGTVSQFARQFQQQNWAVSWKCVIREVHDSSDRENRLYRISLTEDSDIVATCFVSADEKFPLADPGDQVVIEGLVCNVHARMIMLRRCQLKKAEAD